MKLVEEGDVISVREGFKVATEVPAHYLYSNRKGDFTLRRGVVTVSGEFGYLAGEYIVTKTQMDGGTEGRDPFPNGHHVFCISPCGKVKLDFYQTGCFTSLNTTVDILGKAELT